MWFFQQQSNSPHPTGRPVSIDLWDHICGVSADATGWGIETSQTSDASHVFLAYHVSGQVTKTWNFHSISMLKTQSYQWTKSGNFLITVLRVTHRKKLRNNEMEEIFRAGCSGVGCSLHALLSTAPSTHDRLAPPYKLSEPMFMDFYWGLTQEPYVLNHQPVVTDLSLSALLSPQRCRKF